VTDYPEGARPDDAEQAARRRRVRTLRVVGVLALVAVVTVFVVQNSQPVTVRFWFETSRPRLIWVVIACLVLGIAFGYVLASPGRRAARRRKREQRKRGKEVGPSGL
jgi:uncharacterized integral membrane protein